ncbi:hypothetical protein LK07_05860 [Streptomyces pluripotens]|uniref:Uncharacterized protein n=1 Tax=Streptomyces pluripotens TaxID=1355015 RepID=A0A221NUH5_9ACTN|nr:MULTISPECIES: hypothetical protein [Streptomyces]ARP69369.1 hypothetical protein LK06_004770 [Streptomyces pluripotens]ASN23627.1 hypothetical protein LK07_05860 [Streptomyces pluripotens]KIE28341.1 hypothetical protein LK08_02975 [Streptomyces sp. MUSC 125]MCH0555317.1 hypothetical protein [Streptomyces sp. MUM 16J]
MTADPEHPVVQGELAELRRRLDVTYARVEGGLALLSHRTEETSKELEELNTRMFSLEHARWPLPSLAVLTTLGALVVTIWQALAVH